MYVIFKNTTSGAVISRFSQLSTKSGANTQIIDTIISIHYFLSFLAKLFYHFHLNPNPLAFSLDVFPHFDPGFWLMTWNKKCFTLWHRVINDRKASSVVNGIRSTIPLSKQLGKGQFKLFYFMYLKISQYQCFYILFPWFYQNITSKV